MKIYLYYIGKARDPHANAIAEDFFARAARFCPGEMREIRPDRGGIAARHPSARKIWLDPAGQAMDSRRFTKLIESATLEGRDLLFLVGGADGIPAAWRGEADLLVALSPMTFPHELARAMLAEQIYRALATLRGHPYPR